MTETPAPSDAPDLAVVLARSTEFYQALHAVLGDTLEVETRRDLLTQGTCSVAIEHGRSVCVLVEMENVASAIVLQRAQFEAVVRALWLHGVAPNEWLELFFAAVKANPMKDPNFSKQVHEMLPALADSRHAPAVRMLNTLQDAAWGPLNSYVHSGIHPIIQHHAGFPPEYAIQVLRNSNGHVSHGRDADGDGDPRPRYRHGRAQRPARTPRLPAAPFALNNGARFGNRQPRCNARCRTECPHRARYARGRHSGPAVQSIRACRPHEGTTHEQTHLHHRRHRHCRRRAVVLWSAVIRSSRPADNHH